ncbi:MAG TPA: hypothetical protein VNB94_05610 [Mycobacteriales bacterium]|nr:hypothetical protein [Mycobacteriales bacterium]
MTNFTLAWPKVPGRHAKPAILLAGCVSLVMALLVAAVTAAVGLGGFAGLGGLLGGGRLDYARGPLGEFFPLTDGFVADKLGPGFTRTPESAGSAVVPVEFGPGRAVTPIFASVGSGSGRDDVPPPDELSADLGNDNIANAYVIRGLPFSARSTAPATREPGEPTPCGPPGGSRWFQYTPRIDIGLLATTRGTEFGSSIAVYTGSGIGDLTEVGCNGAPNNGNQVLFAAKAGMTYWFQASKTIGDGALQFTLDVQGRTIRASTSNDGRPAEGDSGQPKISADGRYVVFNSEADLVPGTQNGCLTTRHPSVEYRALPDPGPCRNVYRRSLDTSVTELVSTPDGEVGGNEESVESSISADGRFIAFVSWASNLVPGDTNGTSDVFVRDMLEARITRVSVTSEGRETIDAEEPGFTAISHDGRYVGFSSGAPELVKPAPGSTCPCYQVFIRDLQTRRTHLVSVDERGVPYDGDSLVAGLSADGARVAFSTHTKSSGPQAQVVVNDWRQRGGSFVASVADDGSDADGRSDAILSPALSADGRFLAFQSIATNLVPGDRNGAYDTFVRDLAMGSTVRVSVSSAGTESHPQSGTTTNEVVACTQVVCAGFDSATISPDGRYVTFASNAPDLVPGDTNTTYDVFLHDRLRHTTTRLSVLDEGRQSDGAAFRGVLSQDARRVVFLGRAYRPEDDSALLTVYVREQRVA